MDKDLIKIIEKFPSTCILCIGDVMLDKFIHGKVDRISPEAPVPVFQFGYERQMLGGAGNVVANLRSLSATTYFVSALGCDKYAEDICALLSNIGVDYNLIRSKNRQTIVKTRYIASNQHVLRFDYEKIMPLSDLEEKELLLMVKRHIDKIGCIILSDYAKGVLTPSCVRKIIALAKEVKKPVLIDPKGRDFSKYAGAFLIKPNRKELQEATDIALEPSSASFLKDVSMAARKILDAYEIDNMIVTLSEKGMLCVSRSQKEKEIYMPTVAKEVFDVSGAGDTSIATLGAALSCGATLEQAITLANNAAGIVVSKIGTATLSPLELKQKFM